MRQFFVVTLIAAFFATALYAQTNIEYNSAAGIFPIALVLEEARYAADAGTWRPDWPFDLPPDAFKLLAEGEKGALTELSRVIVEGEGYSLNFAFGPGGLPGGLGLIEEFPFMYDGAMTQVSLFYNDFMEIRKLIINYLPGEDPWIMEILEYDDSFPVLARGFRSNTWYFIYISRGVNGIRETWYDVEGNFLGAYSFSFGSIGEEQRIRVLRDFSSSGEEMEFHYDSRGLVTDVTGSYGLYRVLYFREDLPRYWERRPAAGDSPDTGNFTLQWDANGILLRMASREDGEDPVNSRYEYSFDERGNWVERREIRMMRVSGDVSGGVGYYVPTQGTVFRRILEYRYPL